MMTTIIVDKKGTGKTAKTIRESARTGKYILTPNRAMAQSTYGFARQMGVKIPYPVAVSEITNARFKGSSISRDGLIIDEAIAVLEQILSVPIHMITASVRDTDEH